jgi:hypothetical protein
MPTFEKLPVRIEAVMCKDMMIAFERNWKALPKWLADEYEKGNIVPTPTGIYINTTEGNMLALPEDWIIQGTVGEIYPCKPEPFSQVYRPV